MIIFQTRSIRLPAAVFLVFGLWGCPAEKPNGISKTDQVPDTAWGNGPLKEAPGFDIHSIQRSSGDTLHLVTCSKFVYRPFGQVSKPGDVPKSRLKNFAVDTRHLKMQGVREAFFFLSLDSNRLILYFDPDTAVVRSYLVEGTIRDMRVSFDRDLRIGMDKEDFFSRFFLDFPSPWLRQYNVVVLESCVDDIRHVYSFQENLLKQVDFQSTTSWDLAW